MDLSQLDLRVIGEYYNDFLVSIGLTSGVINTTSWILGALILLIFALTLVLGLIWIERKIAARIQDRLGPNRTGPFGLLQTVADAMKLLTKEDITPREADRIAYNLAPALAVFPVIMGLAVLPFANNVVGADINIGVLYVMAFAAIGAHGGPDGGLGIQQQICAAGRVPRGGAIAQLRDPAGVRHADSGDDGRDHAHERAGRGAGTILRDGLVYLGAARRFHDLSSSPPWRKANALPSTCWKRIRKSWPGSTSNIRA